MYPNYKELLSKNSISGEKSMISGRNIAQPNNTIVWQLLS